MKAAAMKALAAKIMHYRIVQEFSRFFVVGSLGFVVDAGILQGLVSFGGWSPYIARIPSFLIAVVMTWALNRRWTFRALSAPLWRSLRAYMSSNSIGLGVNLSVYYLLTTLSSLMKDIPTLALAIASVAAMMVNFLLVRHWAFRDR